MCVGEGGGASRTQADGIHFHQEEETIRELSLEVGQLDKV